MLLARGMVRESGGGGVRGLMECGTDGGVRTGGGAKVSAIEVDGRCVEVSAIEVDRRCVEVSAIEVDRQCVEVDGDFLEWRGLMGVSKVGGRRL